MTENGTVLRALEVKKTFGRVEALRGASFELRRAEIHALVGDNGAGKSTFVKVISGVHQPTAGRIELHGRRIHIGDPHEAQLLGIETVYQDLSLAPDLDAAENIFLGRELMRSGLRRRLGFLDRREMRKRAARELDQLGIVLPSMKARIGRLSGGQRQAVAMARGVIWGQRILILDEPTAALGARQTAQVLSLMQRTRDEKGISIIWISHNMPEVLRAADRITVLRLGRDVATVRAAETSAEQLIAAMTGLSEVDDG
jgi:simple sugar transport system ATP-binding protein